MHPRQSPWHWLLFAVVWLLLGAAQFLTGFTHAWGVAAADSPTATFGSLSSAGALRLERTGTDLGRLVAGQDVDRPEVLRVTNRSDRLMRVKAHLVGAEGLEAYVSPDLLEPGESAWVGVAGRMDAPGEVAGHVRVSAFGGFVERQAPIRGSVYPPPPPPRPRCADQEAPGGVADCSAAEGGQIEGGNQG